MSRIVGVQDKLLHQVTCGVKQDVLENKNTQFKVAFVPYLRRPVCSSAIYGKHWGRNMQQDYIPIPKYPGYQPAGHTGPDTFRRKKEKRKKTKPKIKKTPPHIFVSPMQFILS